MGIVLNNVKPEAGPDYVRYHSHYYHGPDADGAQAPPRRSSATGWRWPAAFAKASGVVALVVAVSVYALTVFWPEISSNLPDWLTPYARLLAAN